MDSMWKDAGIDMHMSIYGCISTGDRTGMIQVVGNAATLASIVAGSSGGESGSTAHKLSAAMGAIFSDDVYERWLTLSNVDGLHSQRIDPPMFDADGMEVLLFMMIFFLCTLST